MNPCDIFKALSDETRLRILVMLTVEELCVGDLEKILKLNQSNVSRHLSKLQGSGLVTSRRAAQHVYYRFNKSLGEQWSALSHLLNNLKIHPGYEVDLAALEANQETGTSADYHPKTGRSFSEEELI